jgi:hypothetical protein
MRDTSRAFEDLLFEGIAGNVGYTDKLGPIIPTEGAGRYFFLFRHCLNLPESGL